jgi:hypothetical protein
MVRIIFIFIRANSVYIGFNFMHTTFEKGCAKEVPQNRTFAVEQVRKVEPNPPKPNIQILLNIFICI